ncbi:MAG: aldehyde dehydrogenase [Planctomycetaceae bacterium]|nr:aldehyde dehydrogenase [Planctomycetaceae bacterium]
MATTLKFDLLPEVADFLSKGPLEGIVGGQAVASSKGETFTTVDPGSGEVLAEVHAMQADDVDRAVQAAARAFTSTKWARLSPNDRGAMLHRLADEVERRKPIIAQIESLDCGKVYAQAAGDVQNFIDTMRYFVEMSLHVEPRTTLAVPRHEAWTARRPWGPCAFVFPWNFPFLLAGWGISPALAAGNTVVIKPAEDTPLSTIYLGRLAKEVGIPDGVINVVPGFGETTGAALASHPGLKRMSFTGSPEVGRLVATACGANLVPVKLELGGKGAAVVFNDVDIDDTATKLAQAITFHTGQVCCDATRWLIHESIYPEMVNACTEKLRRVVVGHELDAGTQMGPVVSEKQRKRVLGYLERGLAEGAEVVLEGGPAEVSGRNGFYVKPALLAGSLNNVAAREEIFGPVAYLTSFRDEDQAVAMVNDTDYGLANSVWTTDPARASRVAEAMVAGNSWINAHNLFPHGVPYGGVNKSGMGGGVLSVDTLMDYYRSTSVVRPL